MSPLDGAPEGAGPEHHLVWKGQRRASFAAHWTEDDRAWVAGFVDGEGSIGIMKVASKTCRAGYYYAPDVTIRQVDRRPLDRIFKLLDGMATFQPVRGATPTRADTWTLNIRNRSVLTEFLSAIVPVLSIKRDQALAVLSFMAMAPYNGPDWMAQGCAVAYERCRALNSEFRRAHYLPTTANDDAWLGAVIEGEGSIGITKHGKQGNGHVYTLRVSVGMTDESFVKRVRAVAGCGSVHVERRAHKGFRDCWWWVASSKKGMAVLERIVTFLDRKKAHVDVARRFYATAITFNMKAGTPPSVLAAKLSCHEEMKALNKKGPRPNASATLELVRRGRLRDDQA